MTDAQQSDYSLLDLDIKISMYTSMVLIRQAEEAISDLVESKEIKTPCHLYIGQAAIAVGVCAALNVEDYIWGGHRSHGHYLAKGGNLNRMMAEIFGRETGCAEGRGGSMHLCAPEVGLLGTVPLVAATIPLAAGSGMASKLRKDNRISVSFFGDGATEEGHFHESINLAALYKLPVIFVCENNLYSSHLQLLERRSADNLYVIGDLYEIPGMRLDGNDVIAVYQATRTAVERAQKGEGPSFMECRTYRWRGHVGHDANLDVGVKRRDELKEWLPKDPVARLRNHLIEQGVDASEIEHIDQDIHADIEAAIKFARNSQYPKTDSLLDHVFSSNEGVS
jgi:pyruvate dehydrogenase E1 component alpha subunit